jgi:hypothetical protein
MARRLEFGTEKDKISYLTNPKDGRLKPGLDRGGPLGFPKPFGTGRFIFEYIRGSGATSASPHTIDYSNKTMVQVAIADILNEYDLVGLYFIYHNALGLDAELVGTYMSVNGNALGLDPGA